MVKTPLKPRRSGELAPQSKKLRASTRRDSRSTASVRAQKARKVDSDVDTICPSLRSLSLGNETTYRPSVPVRELDAPFVDFFDKLSVKGPGLRSSLKKGPSTVGPKTVTFRHVHGYPTIDQCDLLEFEIEEEEDSDTVKRQNPTPRHHSSPHIAGGTDFIYDSVSRTRIGFLKATGHYEPPSLYTRLRPRCKILRDFPSLSHCLVCLRPREELDYFYTEAFQLFVPTFSPVTSREFGSSTELPYFT
jgi:hypothetical protein